MGRMNEDEVKQKDKLAVGIQKAAQHIAEFTQANRDSGSDKTDPDNPPMETKPLEAGPPETEPPFERASVQGPTSRWEMRDRLRFLMEESPLGVYSVDIQGRIKDINSTMVKLMGLTSVEDIMDIRVMDYSPFQQAGIAQRIQKCLESRKAEIHECTIENEHGSKVIIRHFLAPIYDHDGSIAGAWITAEDISGRKQSEDDMRRIRHFGSFLQRTALHFAGDYKIEQAVKDVLRDLSGLCGADCGFAIMLEGSEKKMTSAFEWCAPEAELRLENIIGTSFNRYTMWLEQLQAGHAVDVSNLEALEEGIPERKFLSDRGKNGFLAVPLKIKNRFVGFLGFDDPQNRGAAQAKDIEYFQLGADLLGRAFERRMTEDRLRNEMRGHLILEKAAGEGIFILEQRRIKQVNQVLAELLGCEISMVTGKSVFDFFPQDERKKLEDFLAGDLDQPLASSLALRDGNSKDVELRGKSIRSEEWDLIGISVRAEPPRDNGEIVLKEENERLREAMEGAIQALGFAAEMRDPYMAGHERRVAQLVCAVAEEMGLAPDRIEGLRIAALVHDIGKISIPAEILGKPGKVTESEYNLIRSHPQTGYEILKDIRLPWPVADIVRQHHERMDGSGYPMGLSGDSILLEARIMAVADSIEAISAHRPHRPAEGIEEALQEISRSKGTLYDAAVVDACLKIFRENRFSFS